MHQKFKQILAFFGILVLAAAAAWIVYPKGSKIDLTKIKIPYTKDPRAAGIIYESFNRNNSNHERYLLTDPGTLKFRPYTSTQFKNMFLAGDWIRNKVDVPTMEGAIVSGYTAANKILKLVKNEHN